ncbi:TerB N-terminal domain-containing protein [Lichenihabitans sp. Uapishka_5]|uniref:TerB N-terminal domain-containing protein n=1 Tax=Lichenihabitans sp. Uapishka_5 TaxID=3037302 RepID=UPI0029E7F1A1|nr:TerB N-terminal domain-containing protein [Lichenihabitans sp. Uapishka_5]MDX7951481.1 TerB N-terminal domain-containing protein [Lichenihabitans sp. Uapishka_5]
MASVDAGFGLGVAALAVVVAAGRRKSRRKAITGSALTGASSRNQPEGQPSSNAVDPPAPVAKAGAGAGACLSLEATTTFETEFDVPDVQPDQVQADVSEPPPIAGDDREAPTTVSSVAAPVGASTVLPISDQPMAAGGMPDAIAWMPIEEDDLGPTAPAMATRVSEAATSPQVSERPSPVTGSSAGDRGVIPLSDGRPAETNRPGAWIGPGSAVVVAGTTINGGMVYVGRHLAAQNSPSQPDNCLVDPTLAVARATMARTPLPYWPSYARLDPSQRRAFLDFLAGPRDDPRTEIGIVFLYLYGLERRLIVDGDVADGPAIVGEVQRLVATYANHSFRTYARALLDAHRFKQPGSDLPPAHELDFEPSAEVPWSTRLALGRLAVSGTAVPPDLLLSFVMAHPETRVRTPATRCFPLLREIFAAEVVASHPTGLRIPRGKAKRGLSLHYRAASGTFQVDVTPADGPLPDVLTRSEPLATGRRLLEACTIQLDAYSRELGRLGVAAPTLATIARLPQTVRMKVAADARPSELAALRDAAASVGLVSLSDVQRSIGPSTSKVGRAALAETALVVGRLGLGLVPDPAFTIRSSRTGDGCLLFRLGSSVDAPAAATEAYRSAHVSLALGMMVATADGHVDDSEREALDLIASRVEGLGPDEPSRLHADRAWFETNPSALADLRSLIGAADASVRLRLLRDAATVAAVDGVVSAREVAVIERIAKLLGLEPSDAYSLLHGGAPAGSSTQRATGSPGLDLTRLAAIRAETLGTSSILADVFEDEVEPAAPSAPPKQDAPSAVTSDGMDARHVALIALLSERSSWSRAEFDGLARGNGLMPGAAMQFLNDWAIEAHDELLIEGEEELEINVALLPDHVRETQVASR